MTLEQLIKKARDQKYRCGKNEGVRIVVWHMVGAVKEIKNVGLFMKKDRWTTKQMLWVVAHEWGINAEKELADGNLTVEAHFGWYVGD